MIYFVMHKRDYIPRTSDKLIEIPDRGVLRTLVQPGRRSEAEQISLRVRFVLDEGIAAVATLVVAFSVVGALFASHRAEDPVGWIFLAAAFFQVLSVCGYEYAIYAFVTKPGSLPLGA